MQAVIPIDVYEKRSYIPLFSFGDVCRVGKGAGRPGSIGVIYFLSYLKWIEKHLWIMFIRNPTARDRNSTQLCIWFKSLFVSFLKPQSSSACAQQPFPKHVFFKREESKVSWIRVLTCIWYKSRWKQVDKSLTLEEQFSQNIPKS